MTWRALSARPYPPDVGIRALQAVLQLAASPATAPPAVFTANPFDWTLFLQHVPAPPPQLFAAVAAERDAAAAAATATAAASGRATAADSSEISEEMQAIAAMPRGDRFHAIQAGPGPAEIAQNIMRASFISTKQDGYDMC